MILTKIIKRAGFFLLLAGVCLSSDFLPENGSMLNYTQVFFRWPQIVGTYQYEIRVDNSAGFQIYSSGNNSIVLDNFSWDEEYVWQVCGMDEYSNYISCYEDNIFSIASLPFNYPANVDILAYDEFFASPGITILDYESLNFSIALDVIGNPIWFADRTNFPQNKITVTEFAKNGNFVGYGLFGYEFDLDSEVVFQSNTSVHHSIVKSSSNTYFLTGGIQQVHPCPDYNVCGSIDLLWKGDVFTEVNLQGEVLWEWNVFDHVSLNEYNSQWINYPENGQFDWTHSNSVFIDELNDIVYVSMRNLSRITAIDYNTGEILWNLGNPEFIDNVDFDDYFGFSHQHSAQITSNGNLLFFDNGRDNVPELSRCLEVQFSDDGDAELVWEYILPESMMTLSRGECDRLENGNTLISAGRTGNVIEVSESGEVAWHLKANTGSGMDVSIYRSQRVASLYPNIFSFEIDNLKGTHTEYYMDNDNIEITIFNKGWHEQHFIIELWDGDNQLSNNEFIINNNSEYSLDLGINSDDSSFSLRVYVDGSPDQMQEVLFYYNVSSGDLNNDSMIDILDIVIMINIILGSVDYMDNGDINNDGFIDILDVVLLVNAILDS